MIPTIEFRHSTLYDMKLKRPRGVRMPREVIFQRKMQALTREWRKVGPDVLREISRITRLSWHERDITCFVTAGIRPYSNPLTISLKRSVSEMLDALTHELIHHFFAERENWQRVRGG